MRYIPLIFILLVIAFIAGTEVGVHEKKKAIQSCYRALEGSAKCMDELDRCREECK